MGTAFNRPDVNLSPAAFPIAWPAFGDSLLHWSRDVRRGPEAVTRLDASVLVAIDEAGFASLVRRYELPVRPRRATFNGWVYGALEPVERDGATARRMAAAAEERLAACSIDVNAHWRSSWEPELRRLWGQLEAVDPELLDQPVLLALFDRGMSLAQEAGRIAADVSLQAVYALQAGNTAAGTAAGETHSWSTRLVPFALRRIAHAMGRKLEAAGLVEYADDIAHVTLDELRCALRNGRDLKARVDAGRRESAQFGAVSPPRVAGTGLDRPCMDGAVGRAVAFMVGEPVCGAVTGAGEPSRAGHAA
jgi:hypothetical protein